MSILDHENIIRLKGFSEFEQLKKSNGRTKSVSYFALELANKGELFDYVA